MVRKRMTIISWFETRILQMGGIYSKQKCTSNVVPETCQHWLFKPSRCKTAVLAVNWCSVTGRLLRWTLEQPPVPLSGVLYEQGLSQQDQDMQCGATVNGTSGLVAHRLTNLHASKNQLAQQVSQNPFLYIYTVECDSASSTLSHCVLVLD